ncbi:uncharacterized protein VTP21DRAFT_10849 [Calcarisporiella thermophila]|uniref:uncharacterized protein n=1 Tax=Calcarisporiella thermophila TaxID=911321 RepID=UPI0037427DE8
MVRSIKRSRILEIEDEVEAGPSQPSPSQRAQRAQREMEDVEESLTQSTQRKLASQYSLSDEDVDRMANDLVRLALCCEYRHVNIKRDDINKKVLKEYSRSFKIVFDAANQKLQEVFGFELVELPPRETRHKKGVETRPNPVRAYVLRNTLSLKSDADRRLIKWTEEQENQMGMLMVILSLIYVHNQAISEELLHHYLGRFVPDANADIERTRGEIDAMLNMFVKQGYIDREKHSLISGAEERDAMLYRWAPRSKVLVPEEKIVEFIAEIYGSEDEQQKTRLVREILRYAGSDALEGKENKGPETTEIVTSD